MSKNINVKEVGGFKGFLLAMLIIIIFTGAGIFCLYKTHKDQQMTKNYKVTIGVVIDYREKYDPADEDEYVSPYFDYRYVYAPIVEYEVDGNLYKQYSDKYKRNPSRIGSPIEVAYDPNNPNKAIIDRTKGNITGYFVGGILTLIGPIIMVTSIVIKLKNKK